MSEDTEHIEVVVVALSPRERVLLQEILPQLEDNMPPDQWNLIEPIITGLLAKIEEG